MAYKKLMVEMYVPVEYVEVVRQKMLQAGHYALSLKYEKFGTMSLPSPCEGCRHVNEGMTVSCSMCSRIGNSYSDCYEGEEDGEQTA